MTATTLTLRRVTPQAALLLLVGASAWLGVVAIERHMGSMPGTMGLAFGEFAAVWALMMAAMMLPSVVPFASLYTRTIASKRLLRVGAFATGYLLVWSLAAVPAFGLAWLVDRVVGTHPLWTTTLAVAVFVACGVYQLTPLKDRCLARCRTPLGFLIQYGSLKGRTRDLRVGLHQGFFCLACCWGLMLLLVAFGLMNLVAMLVLAGVVVAEKVSPWGVQLSRAFGVVALALAVIVIFEPALAPGLHGTVPAAPMGRM